MKSIFRAVATVTLFSVITRVLGFFFRIFLSRKLGAEGLGLFQLSASMLTIFMTLVSSGLPLTTAKMVSSSLARHDYFKRNKVVTASVVISIAVSLCCSLFIILLYPVWRFCFADQRAVTILYSLVPSILFSAIYAVLRGALWGKGDFFSCGLTELIEQIVRFLLTFLIVNSLDIFNATIEASIAFDLTCLISSIVVMFIYLKTAKFAKFKHEYKTIIRSATPITGVRISNSLVQPITSLILPTMLILSGYTKSEAISNFGIMMGMSFPMLFTPMAIIGSISMVLIPSLSSLLSLGENNAIKNKIQTSMEISLFLSMIFIPLFLAVGDKIGIVLYDNKLAGEMMQYSSICMVPIAMCNLTGSILNALNLENKSFKNYLWGSLVLIISICIFTPILKIYSITVGYFLSMSLVSILNIKKIKSVVLDLDFNFSKLVSKYTFIVIPSSLFGHFLSNISNNLLPTFFSGLLGGIGCLVMFVIFVNLFKIFDIKEMISIVLSKQKTKKVSPLAKNV